MGRAVFPPIILLWALVLGRVSELHAAKAQDPPLQLPRALHADTTPRNALITLAPISGASKVELVAQTLDAEIKESGDSTAWAGQLTFKLHNTDRTAKADIVLGFPTWGGGALELTESTLTRFTITQNTKPIQPEWQTQPLKLGGETRSVRWLAWAMTLDEDERATIQVEFQQTLGSSVLPVVQFAQLPAALWKGLTGSARYSLRLPALTTPEPLRQLSPADSTFDGRTLTWLFSDYEPRDPIVLQLVKPQIWREIVTARQAMAQGNNAKAALNLASQYLQLARASQNPGDLAQSAAALMLAADADPASPAAPLELARLYEAQLRGDYGPVSNPTDMRAAALEQWERVLKLSRGVPAYTAVVAEAQDFAAQHAFSLAQSARRANAFTAALALLARARAAGSSKIPAPLLANEEQGDHAGLAQQQVEAGQWEEALQAVESGVIGAEAQAEQRAFQPRFSRVEALVSLAGDQQTLTARLTPVPRPSARHEQLLRQWLDALADRALTTTLLWDNDAYQMTILTDARASVQLPNSSASPAELTLVKELLTSAEWQMTQNDGIFSTEIALVGRYSLAETRQTLQAKLQEISRALDSLNTPSADEPQEWVRRFRSSALKQYQNGWQNLLAGSRARVEWRSGSVDAAWELQAGDNQPLRAGRTYYYADRIAATAAALLILLLASGWGIASLRRRARMKD
ncbi:MAG: hypothetical protein HY259_09970 [Chloroflexi bacterium]|nr:hypothetical protein [Chloroflexota bacterium]